VGDLRDRARGRGRDVSDPAEERRPANPSERDPFRNLMESHAWRPDPERIAVIYLTDAVNDANHIADRLVAAARAEGEREGRIPSEVRRERGGDLERPTNPSETVYDLWAELTGNWRLVPIAAADNLPPPVLKPDKVVDALVAAARAEGEQTERERADKAIAIADELLHLFSDRESIGTNSFARTEWQYESQVDAWERGLAALRSGELDETPVRIPADPVARANLAQMAGLSDDERHALDQWVALQADEDRRRARRGAEANADTPMGSGELDEKPDDDLPPDHPAAHLFVTPTLDRWGVCICGGPLPPMAEWNDAGRDWQNVMCQSCGRQYVDEETHVAIYETCPECASTQKPTFTCGDSWHDIAGRSGELDEETKP
jgi:hypothetical protein